MSQLMFEITMYLLTILMGALVATRMIMDASYIIGVVIYIASVIAIVALLIEIGDKLDKAGY